MVELMGENLGKRQQELNIKVKETVKKKVHFHDVKETKEKSDVDKFYKIDVASHYRNTDYIVDVFKCGDSLYISRALKCNWIYQDEYSNIINPDYLHHEIFPHMSLKMKTKMMNMIASQVRNGSRAEQFFTYCKNLKMDHFAQKFLYFTSESYKLNVIMSDYQFEDIQSNLKKLIGTSFTLAEALISKTEFDTSKEYYLMQLAYLYSVDEVQYLNLVEKTVKTNSGKIFGGRISKSIMTKHKNRVLGSPLLYIHKLNKKMLVRHSSSEDAKKYIMALLPSELKKFWFKDFYGTYKHIFNLIPENETFYFFKNAFKSLYGDKPFEMTLDFYKFHYYELFSLEEREKWALKHIEEGKELLGSNKDYIWYKFVNYEQAVKAIKQYILVTSDEDDRNEMVIVLIHSCRNQRDLEKILNYYYERHVNEAGYHKENFIENVVANHNIFEFDIQCWAIFNKILYSMEVYTPGFYGKNNQRAFCVIYNIIHKIDMPEALTYYMDNDIDYYRLKLHSKKLKNEQWSNVYQYLFDYHFKKFQTVVCKNEKELMQKKIRFALNLIHLLESFEKKKEDVPEVILEFVLQNFKKFKYIEMFKKNQLTVAFLIRLLKQNKNLVLEKLSEMKAELNDERIVLTGLLKKIKVYFHNDIANDFLQFFDEYIKNKSNVNDWNTRTSIYGIFLLGDEDCKKQLLSKYIPKEPKIDHSKIDRKLLDIQEAICRFACYSRPPVPLNNILEYIKGDYVHFCLPMFNMYSANLPLPQSIKFITAILDAPLSIQKHGIRLAFKAYSTENMKILMTNVWQKTKNVSLRLVIFKALLNHIKKCNDTTQDDLYDILRMFTLTLHADDQDGIFDLIVSNDIPKRLRGNLLETAWTCLKELSHKKSKNISIKIRVITRIEQCINLMNRDYCKDQIILVHVDNALFKKGIQYLNSPEEALYNALWGLTATYLITCKSESDINESMSLVKLISRETFNQWDYVSENNVYVVVKFFYDFLQKVKSRSCGYDYKDSIYVLPVMEEFLKVIQEFSPTHDVFILMLEIQLFVAMRKIMYQKISDSEEELKVAKLVVKSLISFIESLKNKNQLVASFFDTISTLIIRAVRDMATLSDLNEDIVIAYVCNELVTGHDTYFAVLALSIMPLNNNGTTEDQNLFQDISSDFIKKIKEINNFEVQSCYFKKFIAGDFRKRF